jgi:ribonuclease P protein component
MPRIPSLRHRRDFDRVMSTGARARRGCIQVYVSPAIDGPRLGLAVRVGTAGSVVRNRVRRRLRAAFERCSVADAIDIVVRTDARAAEVDFQELVDALCGSIREAA